MFNTPLFSEMFKMYLLCICLLVCVCVIFLFCVLLREIMKVTPLTSCSYKNAFVIDYDRFDPCQRLLYSDDF